MRSTIAVLLLLFVTPLFAQERREGDRQQPFAGVFRLRGIEFSEDQQAKVEEIRTRYVTKLEEQQRQQNGIYTAEQRRARREALQAAREAGKNAAEARQAAEAAVKLSDAQKQQLAANRKARADLLAQIQAELRKLLTAQQRNQLSRRAGNRNAQQRQRGPQPTHANVKYGPYDRNVMDVWLAESDRPTPVLVSIHGGGFHGGNKSVSGGVLQESLRSGISVVAITYRLSDEAIAPAQFLDSARAIQFIRHHAKEWNIDPQRIAATGGSAGAGISLWLGFHDDLADPDNEDPVLRQSTRLSCMAVYNGQTSYDPRFIRKLIPENDTYQHAALVQLYDADLSRLDDLPAEKYKLFEEVSALPHLTADDPPALLIYGSRMDTPITSHGVGIHHPRFGKALKDKMDSLDIACQVHTGINRNNEAWTKLTMDFVKQHLDAS